VHMDRILTQLMIYVELEMENEEVIVHIKLFVFREVLGKC